MVGSFMPGWSAWKPLPLERLKDTDFILGKGALLSYLFEFAIGTSATGQATPEA